MPTNEEIIARYLELRTRKEKLVSKFEEDFIKPIEGKMKALENFMLSKSIQEKTNSFKTDAGTCYKQTVRSVKVEDHQELLNYVRDHGAWGLLPASVVKSEVEAIIELTNAPPPGVSVTAITKMNFRK